jgi:TM2 domain-containing membrane protein YozV
MSKALVKSSGGQGGGVGGLIPAVCSAIIPGVGQLVNGETDKAIGVFVVAAVSGASVVGAIPLLGSVAGLVYGATWLYGVADGFVQGRRGHRGFKKR